MFFLNGANNLLHDISDKLIDDRNIVALDRNESKIHVKTPVEIEGYVCCEKHRRPSSDHDVKFNPYKVKDIAGGEKYLENHLDVKLCIPYGTPCNPEARELMDDVLTSGMEQNEILRLYTYAPQELEVLPRLLNPMVKGHYVYFTARDFYNESSMASDQVFQAAKEMCEHLSKSYHAGKYVRFEIWTPERHISYYGDKLNAFSVRAN